MTMTDKQIAQNKEKIKSVKNLAESIEEKIDELAEMFGDSATAAQVKIAMSQFEADYDGARKRYRKEIKEALDKLVSIAIAGGLHGVLESANSASNLDPEALDFEDKFENRTLPIASSKDLVRIAAENARETRAHLLTQVDMANSISHFVEFVDARDAGEDVYLDNVLEKLSKDYE